MGNVTAKKKRFAIVEKKNPMLRPELDRQKFILGDARDLRFLKYGSVDLIIGHPPYLDMMDYGPAATIIDVSSFHGFLREVLSEAIRVLKSGRFCCAGIIAARKEGKTFIYSLKDAHTYLHTHNRHNSSDETEYAGHAELPKWQVKLPKEGNMLGRMALDDWKLGDFVYLSLRRFAQKGILVSGASGAGKTIAAKVIVEELLEDEIPVLVFDYTKQWQRLLEKNTNDEMLDRYAEFGMRRSPKGFKGRVVRSATKRTHDSYMGGTTNLG